MALTDVRHQHDGILYLFVIAQVRLYREGLQHCLDGEPDFTVVGTCSSLDEAIPQIAATQPDMALLDIGIFGSRSGVNELRTACPNTRLVALAIQETEAEVFAWARAGMSGYVSRDASYADLVATVRGAARDEVACTSGITAMLAACLPRLIARPAPDHRMPPLTSREFDIVDLIARGYSNKEISRELSIALSTVKNHVHNILGKLRVERRGDAASAVRFPSPPTRTSAGNGDGYRSGRPAPEYALRPRS